jgi:hypothetical protein
VKTSLGISRLEAGRRGVAGGDEWQRSADGEEGDGADRQAPHGSDVREKASLPECAKSKRIRLSANTPTWLGPSGPSARAAACGRSDWIGQVFRPNRTSFEVEKTDK